MSTLRDRIAAIEAQSYTDALERLQAAMDTLERELVLIECGPLTLCRLDDVEVKEQLTKLPKCPKCGRHPSRSGVECSACCAEIRKAMGL